MPPETSIWSPATITAIVAGVLAIMGAFTTMIVTLHGLRKKADETGAKVDEVHVLANSNLSAVTKTLEVAQARIDGLEKLVAVQDSNKKVADDLAAKESKP